MKYTVNNLVMTPNSGHLFKQYKHGAKPAFRLKLPLPFTSHD